MCLREKPTFSWQDNDYDQSSAEVYGIQYATGSWSVQELQPLNGASVPCAVCEAERGDVLTYPGMERDALLNEFFSSPSLLVIGATKCPAGWNEEYQGYIMAEYYASSHYKTEFVCVERHAEKGKGPTNRNQAYLYTTEVQCNGLKCPPYIKWRELSCVVCSPDDSTGSGTVYTRWGKRSCPTSASNATKMLYTGRTASGSSGESGSAPNPLCLPMELAYFQYNDNQQYGARIHGAYYSGTSTVTSTALRAINNKRMPCSLCFVPDVHTHLMVPGRYECPPNWKPEYYGYLFSAYYGNWKLNYICVDHLAEGIASETGGGAAYTVVDIECGSIRCRDEDGGYVANREVTCTVCVPETKQRASVFTRWGAKSCPGSNSTTRMVMSFAVFHIYKAFTLCS